MYLENTTRHRVVRTRNDFYTPHESLCRETIRIACVDIKVWCEIPKRKRRPTPDDERRITARAIIALNWLYEHDEPLRFSAPFCFEACDLDGDVLIDGLLAGLERNRVATLSGYVAAWQKWQEQEHESA